MFEALFGPELPLMARFVLAFIVVLALIGGVAMIARRFGAERLAAPAARGRQPRLAVVDAATVDARRRLILIRRDNVEHLLLVGGPSDVVVEMNIGAHQQTAAPAAAAPRREAAPPHPASEPDRPGIIEPAEQPAPPRVMPAARAPSAEPSSRPARAAAVESGWSDQGREASPRRPADLDIAPGNERAWPALADGPARPERLSPILERAAAAERPAAAAAEPAAMQDRGRRAGAPAPTLDPRDADQNLAEMAQRLEAALRRPVAAAAEGRGPRPAPPPAPPPPPSAAPPLVVPPTPVAAVRAEPLDHLLAPVEHAENAEPRAAEAAGTAPSPQLKLPEAERTAAKAKADFHSLEMEMASLLGRPTDKL